MDAPPPSDAASGCEFGTLQSIIGPFVDHAYYRGKYGDIRSADLDPVIHFANTGWREGRTPNPWFDTAYYLEANPDVRDAGINPLFHYLTQGKAEGRTPSRPGGYLREQIDRLKSEPAMAPWYAAPPTAARLLSEDIALLLAALCSGARGLVLSVSHDRYIDTTGGVQIVIADEQQKFNGDRIAYLHISPVHARMDLAPADHPTLWLQLVIDGRFAGIAPASAVQHALTSLTFGDNFPRLLVIHALLGHSPECITALAAALRPTGHIYWVHDYFSLCPGFHLLRNDIAFCNAPPPDSMACRVCIHGTQREAIGARLATMFRAMPFRVVAPSQLALDLWQSRATLPAHSTHVLPHCRYQPDPAEPRAETDVKVVVAFAGMPTAQKGAPAFHELVQRCATLAHYSFIQFATEDGLQGMDRLATVTVHVGPADRLAMVSAFRRHRVDIVLILSPWPETFSLVTYEAFAAGAQVAALAASGNAAAAVRAHGLGVVLDDEAAMLAYFASGEAAAMVRTRNLRHPGVLIHRGTSALFDPSGQCHPDDAVTDEPDLHLLVDGVPMRPQADGSRHSITLPTDARCVRILSRSCVPSWMYPDQADSRRLGVAVEAIRLDGQALDLTDPLLGDGWHQREELWRWTNGDATLLVAGATLLEISVAPAVTYLRLPHGTPA